MKDRGIFNWLADASDLPGERFPGQSLIEITGDYRVLIENHCGVKEYCTERIRVNVEFGQVVICGSGLELARMTKEQLVICGKINGVTLHRRCG